VLILPVLGALILVNRDKPVLVLGLALVAPVCVLGVLLYIARARVFVTPARIGKRGFGPTRWVDKEAVYRSLFVKDLRTPGSASQSVLFLFAPDGARVMRLYGDLWAERDLLALAEASGAAHGVRAMPVSTAQLARDEPTALNWLQMHPKETVWITMLLFVAVAVLVVIVAAIAAR